MRRFSRVLVTVSVLLFSASCTKKSGETPSQTAASLTEIRIGQFGSMTGGEATFGQSTDKGIRLAIDARNAAGGIKGKQIKLITEDNQGKPEEASAAESSSQVFRV